MILLLPLHLYLALLFFAWLMRKRFPISPPRITTHVVAPGWYADPWGRWQWRYWDGQVWTSHTRSALR